MIWQERLPISIPYNPQCYKEQKFGTQAATYKIILISYAGPLELQPYQIWHNFVNCNYRIKYSVLSGMHIKGTASFATQSNPLKSYKYWVTSATINRVLQVLKLWDYSWQFLGNTLSILYCFEVRLRIVLFKYFCSVSTDSNSHTNICITLMNDENGTGKAKMFHRTR